MSTPPPPPPQGPPPPPPGPPPEGPPPQGPPPEGPPPHGQPSGPIPSEARNWAMLAHLSALAALVIPFAFGWVLGPLVVWLLKRESHPFVDQQGKEALNFAISVTIYGFVAVLSIFVLIGFVLIPVVVVAWLVLVVVASVKAASGEAFRYPVTIRFLS